MTLTTRAALFLAVVATGCVDTPNTPAPMNETLGEDLPIVATKLSLTTPENMAVSFDVAESDSSVAMTFTASRPHHGQLSGSGPTFTYTPIVNWNGSDTIDVTASDGVESRDIPVTITVTPVDQAPIAVDDTLQTTVNTPVAVPVEDLLANDEDVDSLILSITAVQNATHGTVTFDGSTVTFTPDTGFSGDASFDYTLSDGQLTATGHVAVTVD